MRKTVMIAAALAAVSLASPAFAEDFSGPRVGVELGVVGDDVASTDEGTYGVNVGYDFDLGKTVVGVTAAYTAPFDDDFNLNPRELSVGARAGYKVASRTLVYGSAAYSNIDAKFIPGSIDGVKFGVGVEQSFGNVYANLETRYGNYEAGIEAYQTVIGVGYRF